MPGTRIGEKALTCLLYLSALIIIGILLAIVGYIVYKGLAMINLDFIMQAPRRAGKEGGISSTIVGTLYLTVLSLAIAAPLGVGTAIHLEEYAQKESYFAYLVTLTAETLAAIPSIIYGLFGFVFFVIYLKLGWSIWSGSLTLAIMVWPTITRTAQEAILSVPREYRENSLALGASKLQTIRKIVIPAAIPGIVTGMILALGRAIGETAAVLLTAGTSLGMPLSPADPARSMSVHLYMLAMEGLSMERAFGTAFLIIILLLFINYLANRSMSLLSHNGG